MRSISAEVITTGRLGASSRADEVDGGRVGVRSGVAMRAAVG